MPNIITVQQADYLKSMLDARNISGFCQFMLPISKRSTAWLRVVRTWAVTVLFGMSLTGCLAETPITGAQQANDSVAVGNLKGIRVAIPQRYRFFSVLYEGEDTWRPETKRKAPATFDTPISSFSILVRLPNMEPLSPTNEQSWRDFQMNNGKDDSWIDFQGDAKVVSMPVPSWGKASVDLTRSVLVNGSPGWRLRRLEQKRYGLTVEVLDGPDKADSNIWIQDLMYDEPNWTTVIRCGAGALGAGGHHICRQFFVIPEMNLSVSVQYHANNLVQWAAIQREITELVKSFRVF